MILHRLTIENFRQFKGRHELLFACGGDAEGQNVTVIYGENGRGKTGVFRALMFGLYGDRRLTQDDDGSPKGELCLVNLHALRERESGDTFPTVAFVETEFVHGATLYVLRRTLSALVHEGKTVEEITDVSLIRQDEVGNATTLTDPKDVQECIEGILDPGVKEYFLFDGERIERLTRASVEQRREVSKGIRNLLNIDDLEAAIKASRGLSRHLDIEIQGKSTGEHARVIKQINELEDRDTAIKKRIGSLDEESSLAKSELQKVDKELEKYNEISDLLKARQEYESRQNELDEQAKGILSQMRARATKTAVTLVESVVRDVFARIDARKKRGELPPEIRQELIVKILDEGKCICGRPITHDQDAKSHILQWKERSEDPGVSDAALELWRYLSTITARLDDERPATESLLQRYAELRHEDRTIQQKLEQIKEQIGASERNDAAQLEKHRERIREDMIRFEAERQNLRDEQSKVSLDLEGLRAKRTQLESELSIRNELIRRAHLASLIQQALTDAYDAFRADVVERIGQDATALLRRLLDDDGQKNLRSIIVKEDYSLQMMDKWNGQFLANISAGQRQIMSISFILALARAAAGGGRLEMPLFMDTPFGRLSFEHRENLIKELPQLASQWILLATDTELGRDEGQLLLDTGRLGRFYRLAPASDGTTTIEARDMKDVLPILRRQKS